MWSLLKIDLPWQVWVAILGAAILLITGIYIRHESYNAGSNAATQEIHNANEEARRKAAEAAKTVEECYDRDGEWDRTNGVCHYAGSR